MRTLLAVVLWFTAGLAFTGMLVGGLTKWKSPRPIDQAFSPYLEDRPSPAAPQSPGPLITRSSSATPAVAARARKGSPALNDP
jgi:hypothetical protein